MLFTYKKQPAGYTDVWFGWELQGLCPLESGITVGAAVQQAARFVRSLYTPELDVAYELAAQSRPDGAFGPSLALRVRVSHHNRATAQAKAAEVAAGLGAGLALWERLDWVPLSKTRYAQLFEGFAAGSVWEISRRTSLVDFMPETYTAASGRHALAVSPFPPTTNPFCRIMHILNGCREHVRLSVALAPARLSEREFKFLNAQRQVLAQKTTEDESSPLYPFAAPADIGTAGMAASQRDSCFLLRIYAAAMEPLPAIIANSLGCAIAAPSGTEDSTGGFKIQLLEDADERKVAVENLELLRFNLAPFESGAVYGRLSLIVHALEAAAVFRFPTALCPGIDRVGRAAPFVGLPAAQGTLIGFASNISSERVAVRLSPESRLRHTVVTGQTGTGKSSLLLSLALQDIKAGQGVAVLDPHGDLYSRLLANIPTKRLKDVVTFDCAAEDPGHINLLENNSAGERDRIVDNFLDLFGQLFNLELTGGPIFTTYFRIALTLVLCQPQPKLEDFVRFFYDKPYRLQCIELCKDSFVTDSWQLLASASGELSLSSVAPYITSKLGGFLYSQRIRKIVSCRESSVDFNAIIKKRQILLVSFSKGVIGRPAASFLGLLFIEKLLRSAMSPENKGSAGKNFYMFCDEFQNVASAGAAEILAEARKFNFGAVLALQHLGQLPAGVLKSLLGNVGNHISMRMGPEDAGMMEDYFQPAFSKADLLNLPVGVAAASILSAAGAKPGPFKLSTSNGLAVISSCAAPGTPCSGDAAGPPLSVLKPARRPRGSVRQLKTDS